ncbi:malate transporter [Thermoanaerobacterium thermosaccharolyticum]|uniref:AEC family transporter n=1 Tax=Thermoanaerobacterium thermosaccharolyticum TaxID=1517 RepID=UPI000C087DB0|nr:AEC family transporter [Thermoanaerobacterium thermosaccharolyticum]PHO07952.1 malate transporter [Thermoanaerobacterium thermosaccharolyticum]
MVFLKGIESILPIVFIIILGYILAMIKWLDESTSELFSKIVVKVSLPALMFYTVIENLQKNQLSHMVWGLIAAFLSIFASYVIAYLSVILFKLDRKKIGLFSAIFAFSNTIFVGLPVNQALFGNKAVPYVLLYYVANTTLFWTMGLYNIRRDVENPQGNFSIYQAFKKIFSPPLLGYLVGILFILIGFKTPQFIVDTAKYIGQLTTPLSMIFIGISIYLTDLKDFKFDSTASFLLIGRSIITPLITMLVLHFFKLNILMEKVFVIQSALPVMTQIAIVAHAYNSDQKYPSIMIAATNLLSLLIVPIYMYIASVVF